MTDLERMVADIKHARGEGIVYTQELSDFLVNARGWAQPENRCPVCDHLVSIHDGRGACDFGDASDQLDPTLRCPCASGPERGGDDD